MANTKNLSSGLTMLLGCATLACAIEGQQQERINPDAQLQQDFNARIEKYMDLRKPLKKQGPQFKETADAARITEARDALSEKIRAARKDAGPGEIFTPEIRNLFRRLMYPELKGPDAAETKQVIKEDAPAKVSLKVNAKYPEGEPLPTVPPNLLAALPKLPEALEYRIVKKDLILRDAEANLIVDFIPNAVR